MTTKQNVNAYVTLHICNACFTLLLMTVVIARDTGMFRAKFETRFIDINASD